MGLVDLMTERDAYTLNGAVTNSTTHNFCLDLFFIAGACRNESDDSLKIALTKSYAFNRVDTLKIIYWAGDIRQGAGERRFFKVALKWLYENHRDDFYLYLNYDPEFSRWDVLFNYGDDEKVLDYICDNLNEGNALLCKWLPRRCVSTDKWKNSYERKENNTKVKVTSTKTKKRINYNFLARKIRERLGWDARYYRKFLKEHSNTVEQLMSEKRWSEIDYSKVPSVAINKYNKAWYRNDKERFEKYIEDVRAGKTKINASVIFPHDIIKNVIDFSGWSVAISNLNKAQITQWENLPNYLSGVNSILPVCDTSGSMYQAGGLPALISLSLGLYISERNEGIFKDAFITFSENPKMQYLKGNINERLCQLAHAEWGNSTNLLGVFDTILLKAVENHLPANEMPKTILIISDMEFNCCGKLSNYDSIRLRYMSAGYNVPNIVFWNVNGRVGNCPITMNDSNVALVSGASPSIIKSVLSGDIDPVGIMRKTIDKERYSFID